MTTPEKYKKARRYYCWVQARVCLSDRYYWSIKRNLVHWRFKVSTQSPRHKVPFPATVALLHHERLGPVLFDTGYSPHFYDATKKFPEKLYALITPVEIPVGATLLDQLKQRNIQAEDIQYIILSHFHADHIGGLLDFPKAQFIYLQAAYAPLQHIGRLRAILGYGFLKQLIPDNFLARSLALKITAQNNTQLDYAFFNKGHDIFGDGSIIAVELPGHAPGHMGLMVHADNGHYFLVGDACWVKENYINSSPPHWLVRHMVLHDAKKYEHTLDQLKHFSLQHPKIHIIPCHCEQSLDSARGIHV